MTSSDPEDPDITADSLLVIARSTVRGPLTISARMRPSPEEIEEFTSGEPSEFVRRRVQLAMVDFPDVRATVVRMMAARAVAEGDDSDPIEVETTPVLAAASSSASSSARPHLTVSRSSPNARPYKHWLSMRVGALAAAVLLAVLGYRAATEGRQSTAPPVAVGPTVTDTPSVPVDAAARDSRVGFTNPAGGSSRGAGRRDSTSTALASVIDSGVTLDALLVRATDDSSFACRLRSVLAREMVRSPDDQTFRQLITFGRAWPATSNSADPQDPSEQVDHFIVVLRPLCTLGRD